jgi:lipopolysaccharide export system permease protein
MTNILSTYLMRTILTGTLLVVIVLVGIATLFEFIGELDNKMGDYGMVQALQFSLLFLPQLSVQMLPMATLIGALLGLGALASNSELVVMRSAGLSVASLAGMVAMTGIVLMVMSALIGEFIGPPLDQFARKMRTEARFQKEGRDSGHAAWVKDGPVILHLERVNSESEFGGVYLFRFNEDNSLRSVGRAENSGIDDSDKWILENYRETRFQDDGFQVVESPVAIESFNLSSDLLGITLTSPGSLSTRGLLSYIRYLKKNSLSSGRYEIELWSRISRTATIVVMPVLALTFVLGSSRSSGAGGRLMIGVLIGLAYYLASEMIASSGEVYNLNPALVTWLPTLALLAVTIFALGRIK